MSNNHGGADDEAMDEVLKAPAPESSPDSRRWIGRIVIAVVLGEAIWAFLVAITNNLVLPALARVIGENSQSSLPMGKSDFNLPALFPSVVELCLAGIAAVLLYSWTQKPGRARSQPVRLAPVAAPHPASVTAPPASQPASRAVDPATQTKPSVKSIEPASRPAQASTPAKPPASTKPKRPKRVYYNIVGERVEEDED